MRKFPLIVLLILLTLSPAQAQTPFPPTPPPSGGSLAGTLNEVNESAELLRDSVAQFGAGQVLLVIVVVLVVLFVAIILRPIIVSNTESNRAVVSLSTSIQAGQTGYANLAVNSNNAMEDVASAVKEFTEQSKVRQKTDETLVNTLTSVYDTQLKLKTLFEQYRDEGMKTVRDEMHAGNEALQLRLDGIVLALQALKVEVPSQALRIDAIIQTAKEVKSDTGRLDASKVPDTDPARSSDIAPELPDPWKGDHPPEK